MATAPAFAATPRTSAAAPAASAVTTRDGTGALTTLFTAGVSAGSRVDYIQATQIAATPIAGAVTLFIHDGTNSRYYGEISFANTTAPSATVAPEKQTLTPSTPILLPPGHSLRCAPTVAKEFVVIAIGGDF